MGYNKDSYKIGPLGSVMQKESPLFAESSEKGLYSAVLCQNKAESRERHSRASQREIEAFWKQSPIRVEAIETHEVEMERKSHTNPEKAKDRLLSS